MAVWPRPCLDRPLLRRLDGIAERGRCVGGGGSALAGRQALLARGRGAHQ